MAGSAAPIRVTSNNQRTLIVEAKDVVAAYNWTDFGGTGERLGSIVYTSATYPGLTATKTFNYTLVGDSYRLDSVTWSVV